MNSVMVCVVLVIVGNVSFVIGRPSKDLDRTIYDVNGPPKNAPEHMHYITFPRDDDTVSKQPKEKTPPIWINPAVLATVFGPNSEDKPDADPPGPQTHTKISDNDLHTRRKDDKGMTNTQGAPVGQPEVSMVATVNTTSKNGTIQLGDRFLPPEILTSQWNRNHERINHIEDPRQDELAKDIDIDFFTRSIKKHMEFTSLSPRIQAGFPTSEAIKKPENLETEPEIHISNAKPLSNNASAQNIVSGYLVFGIVFFRKLCV